MADYISRDAVLELVEPDARPFLAERIRNIPAADVAPVRCGTNVEQEYDPVDRFQCSECGIILEGYIEVRVDEDDGDETYHEFVIRFCPNCGAKLEVDR